MPGLRRRETVAAVASAALVACGGNGGDTDPARAQSSGQFGRGCERTRDDGGRFDSARACRDVLAQVGIGPRPAGTAANRFQARVLRYRLRKAGVRDVRIQTPNRNVVGRIPGRRQGRIVIGAHHDTKDIEGFVGANDGASGVAVVLELARALARRWRGPEIRIALFDAEEARGNRPFSEDGTRGARQYVRGARRILPTVRAMVLFDMVGDCDLRIPREASSSEALYRLFTGPAFGGTTGGISDDHIPFIEAGIPAVDLIDFTFGPGGSPGAWWHTLEDTPDKVCQSSLNQVGEAAMRALPRIASVAPVR